MVVGQWAVGCWDVGCRMCDLGVRWERFGGVGIGAHAEVGGS